MKFIASCTELLSHLQAISRVIDLKSEHFEFDEIQECYVLQQELGERNIKVENLFGHSVCQLIRLLLAYLSSIIALLFRQSNTLLYRELSIFFGLCCSSSGYIFNAITGTSSHPIPA
jgi:hypothetical protein